MEYKLCAFADEADPMLCGQIEAMKRNGIGLLEIRGVDGENIAALSPQKVRAVARQLEDSGLGVWSIGSPIGKIRLCDDFQAHTEIFRRLLDYAGILGARAFRLFSFYEAQNEQQEVVDRLGTLLSLAQGYDVRLCHENEKGIFGDTAPRVKLLLDALPELGSVFDPANFIQCGQETLSAWELLKDRTDYLHIKDCLADGTVVPSGYGDGALAHIVKDFLSRGGRVMTLEPHLMVFQGLTELEEEGGRTAVGSDRFVYPTNNAAFDAAVNALKAILK